ncbi:hypothetical protein AAHC03_09391 [Spirometra sp. Aus1]
MDVAYWICPTSAPPRDAIFVFTAVVSSASLVLNLGILITLCFLTGRTTSYLIQLRALTASTVICSLIGFLNHVVPHQFMPKDPIFGRIVCHLWRSRYIFDVSYIFGALILNFLVGNRAIQITYGYQYSFSPSLFSDLTYLLILGLSSVLSILCQAFVVEWNGMYCMCLEKDIAHWALVAAYMGTFVRFGLAVVISPIILCISCYKIIQWVRNTPAEELSDTWNSLVFPGTPTEQMAELIRPRGWMTASMCTVSLSLNFLAFSLYHTMYPFSCAVGWCTMVIYSVPDRIGTLLLYHQLLLSPVIIAVYIPALRAPCIRFWKRLISKLTEDESNINQTEIRDQHIPEATSADRGCTTP